MACEDGLVDETMETTYAKESSAIARGRKKLLKEMLAERRFFTEDALRKKVSEIQKSISKYSKNRVVLREKSIKLFDGNENSKKASKKIVEAAARIRQDYQL